MAVKTKTQLESGRDFGDLLDSITPALLNVEAITAARTLDTNDSGKVFTLDSAGGAYYILLNFLKLFHELSHQLLGLQHN